MGGRGACGVYGEGEGGAGGTSEKYTNSNTSFAVIGTYPSGRFHMYRAPIHWCIALGYGVSRCPPVGYDVSGRIPLGSAVSRWTLLGYRVTRRTPVPARAMSGAQEYNFLLLLGFSVDSC